MIIRHDLLCPDCGHTIRDHLIDNAIVMAAKAGERPLHPCPVCEADLGRFVDMVILYDSKTAYGNTLLSESFVIDVHDGHQNYQGRVSSLNELRAIERQSESNAKNIPGCTPLVFRDFSQDRSNRAVNTLTDTKWERGRAKKLTKRETVSGMKITASRIPEPD